MELAVKECYEEESGRKASRENIVGQPAFQPTASAMARGRTLNVEAVKLAKQERADRLELLKKLGSMITPKQKRELRRLQEGGA